MTQTANNYGTVLYELGVAGEVVAETEREFFLLPRNCRNLWEARLFPQKRNTN